MFDLRAATLIIQQLPKSLLKLDGWRTVMLIQFLVLLLIAGVCGALGQAIVGYSHGGCLVRLRSDLSARCWEYG